MTVRLRQLSLLVAAAILALAGSASVAASGAATPEPLRMAGPAFGSQAVVEVRDLPHAEAQAAILDAFSRIRRIQVLTDPDQEVAGGVGALQIAASAGATPVEPELLPLLIRALEICNWSDGAHGPFGGRLYDLWRSRPDPAAPPPRDALGDALSSAACAAARLDLSDGTLTLAAGTRLDLAHFAPGYAVDRAVAALREAGAGNGWVAIGGTVRAFGPGPSGTGWAWQPPPPAGMEAPRTVNLRDRSAAAARRDDDPLSLAGEALPGYLDQRRPADAPLTGRPGFPARGVAAVYVVTETALDARALAGGLFVLGAGPGEMALGAVRPDPSVLWLLGGSVGSPLVTTHRWSMAGH